MFLFYQTSLFLFSVTEDFSTCFSDFLYSVIILVIPTYIWQYSLLDPWKPHCINLATHFCFSHLVPWPHPEPWSQLDLLHPWNYKFRHLLYGCKFFCALWPLLHLFLTLTSGPLGTAALLLFISLRYLSSLLSCLHSRTHYLNLSCPQHS